LNEFVSSQSRRFVDPSSAQALPSREVLVIDVSNPLARCDGAEIVKRAFNAINYAKLSANAHRQGELVGVPIAGDDPHAIPRYARQAAILVPGTPLGGEHTATEIRQIVTNLH
jgi:hypothetical protein